MRTMKKVLVSALVFLPLALFSIEAEAQRKIGILMFSEEARYIEAEKGIKDKLSGSIGVESEVGKGSTFWFVLLREGPGGDVKRREI